MKALNQAFTKYGEIVYPYYLKREEERGTIYVKQSPSQDSQANNLCIIYFEVIKRCSVHIHEIPWTGNENKGYGSVAIRALIIHCINKGYLGITGWLSPRDSGHICGLLAFYKKNGFDIKMNSARNGGKVQLDLTNPNKLLKNLTTIPFQERISLLENQLKMQQQKEKELQEKIVSLEHDIANESKVVKFLKKYI
ncbi:hypothetical protein C3744_27495 [Priestia megaterium]|uniref:Uncharacterized protein n=1 Tax=Priestia megaterium TaxID=1404 RepID=A0A3D8WV90_PRIMG|nr:hypothetical protein [Priestia megaterium]MDH3169176.1 hypothetical protein [Priestia megaterium]MDH3169223.1 hypothetical protein [Priestia megaterium]RDZ07703.1 hypothetical protein C3744_27495 [Priestia megaterium]